uniref:Kisspeptin-type receptor 4 n=1 Tax=Asterias rubens TaxID=7604 RepID=A0A8E6HPR5_ASTRU|nr:kisspeptin-type receptor 4 [Asterias rubens]
MTTTVATIFPLSTLGTNNDSVGNETFYQQPADLKPPHHALLMPILFGILMVVGIVGNTLVIFVILKMRQFKTVTNYYVVNLAVADILFLCICAPSTAAQYGSPSFLGGRFMCKMVYYMQSVSAQVTCLFLVAMSIDRFQAIVRPLKSLKTRTLHNAATISIVIWLFAVTVYIPLLVFFDTVDIPYNGGIILLCKEFWSKTWSELFSIWIFLFTYTLPLVVISICYSMMILNLWQRVVPTDALSGPANDRNLRQKRKITWMVLTVVIVFAVCWLPVHVIQIWMEFDVNFPYTMATLDFKAAGHALIYINSCANPFIYTFLGENFQKNFKKTFHCCFKKVRPTREGAGHVANTGTQQGSSSEQAGTRRKTGGGRTQMSTLTSSNVEAKGIEQIDNNHC